MTRVVKLLFAQLFVGYDAVAWPGEMDLAQEAMYAQIVGGRGERQGVGLR